MRKYLFLLFFSLLLQANDYVVIANKHLVLENVTRKYLKQIYLKQHTYIGNSQLIPVNLQAQSNVRKSFEKHVLEMSRNRLKRFWTVQHYKGKRPPLTMSSPKSAIKFVTKIEGALSYIPAQALSQNSAVRVIYSWSDK